MAITCITGRKGSGKTTHCVEIMRELMKKGQPVIYLVPEQDTVETELFLSRALELDVMWNAQVLSPTRLVQRIRTLAGGSAHTWLSDAGRAMALKGTLLSLRSSMRYFKHGSQSVADMLGDLMVEFKRGEVDSMQLRLAADRLPPETSLAQKMYDLAAIFEGYDERLKGRYLDGEDALGSSAALIAQCDEFRDATVIVDGFDVIARTTLRLISALGAQCKQVYVTFSLAEQGARDGALYEQVRLSYATLQQMCAQAGVEAKRVALEARPFENAQIDFLSRQLFSSRPEKWAGDVSSVSIVQAKDPYMEAERAAGYLFEKCRLQGLRYRDMAILCADMDTYGQRLRLALERRGMRAYIDMQPCAADHPVAQYLIAALTCAARYYRADDMLRCLKTGYVNITHREADRLELYAMEKGLEGKFWELPIEQDDVRSTRSAAVPIRPLDEVRRRFVEPIAAFRGGGQTRSALAFCTATVRLMADGEISSLLAQEHKRCQQKQDLVSMQVVRQVQAAINQVLDQAVELCGDEPMHIEDFIKLFSAGLASISIGSIPMSPDAVYVGELSRFMGRSIKVLYVVGVNADKIPARRQDTGLLADYEKTMLLSAAKQAGAPMHINLLSNRAAIERFTIFGAFATPLSELVLSYASVDARGAAMRKSPLILRIEDRIFPTIVEQCGVMGDRFVYAGAPQSMREALSAGLRAYLGGAPLDAQLLALYQAYKTAQPDACDEMLAQLVYDGASQPLSEENAQALYIRMQKQQRYDVDGMVASISQLETYAMCPFAHFITYGIRPRELREPQMDARERGTLQHKAIERFVGRLYQQTDDLTDDEAEHLMSDVLAPLFEEDAQKRNRDGGLVQATHWEIGRTMRRMSKLMAMQKRLSKFRVSEREVSFTPNDAPPLTLANGQKVYLEGKIDRVDLLRMDGDLYARVIDYKSGNTSLGLDDVYYGLRLQLFLYLDAVLTMQDAKPAGIFYQKLGDAQMRLDGGIIDEKLIAKQNKKLKLTGYILDNERVIEQMCTDPHWMDQVLPVTPKVRQGKAIGGEFTQRSKEKMLSEDDFSLLRRHTRRKLRDLAQQMLDGNVRVSPAETADIDACKYCAYASICGFDESLDGCEKRRLGLNNAAVMQKMREED